MAGPLPSAFKLQFPGDAAGGGGPELGDWLRQGFQRSADGNPFGGLLDVHWSQRGAQVGDFMAHRETGWLLKPANGRLPGESLHLAQQPRGSVDPYSQALPLQPHQGPRAFDSCVGNLLFHGPRFS